MSGRFGNVSDPPSEAFSDAVVTVGRSQPPPTVTLLFDNPPRPAYLEQWRAKYDRVFAQFVAGKIQIAEAKVILRGLRFRDEALRIEILELVKAQRQKRGPALVIVS